MPSDVPSRADRELVARLRRAGLEDMSATRLRRWQKEGVMVRSRQTHAHGQRGSTSAYPDGAFEQALEVGRTLKRHRSFAKVAALMFARGYPIEAKALRDAAHEGLDAIDRDITGYLASGPAGTPRAERVADGILTEPLREKHERAQRRRLVAAAAGDRLQAYQTRTVLARLYLGDPISAGALLGAFRTVGQNYRQALGIDEHAFALVEQAIDQRIAEVAAAGGGARFLRDLFRTMDDESFANLRDLCRGCFQLMAALGFTLDLGAGFIAELYDAIIQPPQFDSSPVASSVVVAA